MVTDDGASHTQSVERLIQKITKVSDIVFSAERREQYERAGERAGELRGEGRTKADFGKITLCSIKLKTKFYNFSWNALHWRVGQVSPRPFNIKPGGLGGR